MDYQKVYDQLVQKNHTFSEGEYFETHHKVPKSLGGTDDENNLVDLTAREHYIAHLLLVKITEQRGDKTAHGKMLYAFNCMKWGRCDGERSFKYNSRLYQKIKSEYANLRKLMMKSSDNPHRGTIWIHSDELKQNKQWKKELPLPNGWKVGRVIDWELHFRKSEEKKMRISKRIEKKRLYSEMYNVYAKFGWDYMVRKYRYKYSLTNFANRCKLHVKEFVSQKGKKRGT